MTKTARKYVPREGDEFLAIDVCRLEHLPHIAGILTCTNYDMNGGLLNAECAKGGEFKFRRRLERWEFVKWTRKE